MFGAWNLDAQCLMSDSLHDTESFHSLYAEQEAVSVSRPSWAAWDRSTYTVPHLVLINLLLTVLQKGAYKGLVVTV